MSKKIAVQFTTGGVGTTGLSPVITIYNETNNTTTITSQAMTEDPDTTYFAGHYFYLFSQYDPRHSYKVTIDAGVGTVDEQYKGFYIDDAYKNIELSKSIQKTGGVDYAKLGEAIKADIQAVMKDLDIKLDLPIISQIEKQAKELEKISESLQKEIIKDSKDPVLDLDLKLEKICSELKSLERKTREAQTKISKSCELNQHNTIQGLKALGALMDDRIDSIAVKNLINLPTDELKKLFEKIIKK